MSWFAELPADMQTTYADFADKSPGDVLSAYGEAKANSSRTLFDTLPDEIKGNEAFASYKDMQPSDLVKSHAELSGKVKNAIEIPPENATEEQRQEFNTRLRQAMGGPEKPEDYPVKLPEGISPDAPLLKAFLTDAHKTGYSPAQAQTAIETFVNFSVQQRDAERQQTGDALKIQWGPEFEANMKASIAAMKEVAKETGIPPEEVEAEMERTGWGNNLMLIKMYHKLSRFYQEGKMGGQGGQGRSDDPSRVAKNWYPEMK
jgi:hypothetical protein